MTKSSKVAETFNLYFVSVTESLDIFNWPCLPINITDKIQDIFGSFPNHFSILKIKQK